MTQQLARYENLVPYQSQHAQNGIPREVMEYLAASRVYPVVSPAGLVGRNANAHLRGWPGLCITIAECVAGHGPVAHNHTATLETFFCIDGVFEVLWGNGLVHKIVLQPGDLCSVPSGLYRSFKNISDADARLLVLIQGDADMSDKIEMPRAIGSALGEKYGGNVLDLLAGINMRFQGEDTPEFTPAQMQSRIARVAGLNAVTTADGETVYPVMSPKAESRSEKSAHAPAPVECWTGLSVALMQGGAVASASGSGKPLAGHCQWLVNVGEGEWEITQGETVTTLKRMDMVCIEPDTQRSIKPLAAAAGAGGRLLVANQGRDTIRH